MRSRNSARLRLASPQRVAAHFIPLSSLGRPTNPVAASLRPSRATTKPPTLTPGSMSQCICSRKQRPRSAFETPPRKAGPRFNPTFLAFAGSPDRLLSSPATPLFPTFRQKKERREHSRASTLRPTSKLFPSIPLPLFVKKDERIIPARRNEPEWTEEVYFGDGLKSGLPCRREGVGNCFHKLKKELLCGERSFERFDDAVNTPREKENRSLRTTSIAFTSLDCSLSISLMIHQLLRNVQTSRNQREINVGDHCRQKLSNQYRPLDKKRGHRCFRSPSDNKSARPVLSSIFSDLISHECCPRVKYISYRWQEEQHSTALSSTT